MQKENLTFFFLVTFFLLFFIAAFEQIAGPNGTNIPSSRLEEALKAAEVEDIASGMYYIEIIIY